jgi:hypothetical protein
MAEETLGRAVLALTTDDSGLGRGLDAAERQTQGWAGRVGGVLKGGLLIGGAVAVAAGAAVVGILADSTKAAMEAEAITKNLEAVIASTGGVAGMSKAAVEELSNSLSLVIPVEDDVITGAQAMLLTFKNINKDIFPATTEAVLDMATAMNRGAIPSAEQLQSTSIMLGKALNDPVAGLTALGRAGVQFTDAQKEAIKAMVEGGDMAGAQAVILKELQSQFGGAARAAGTTFAGQMAIASNQIGNIKEQIGGAMIPVLQQMATALGPGLIAAAQAGANWMINTLIPAIQSVVTWVTANWPLIAATAEQVWNQVSTIVGGVINTIASIVAGPGTQATTGWTMAWQRAQEIIAAILPPIQAVIQTVMGAIAGFMAAHGEEIKTALAGAWQTIGQIIDVVMQLIQATIVPILTAIGTYIAAHGTEIQAILGNAWTFVRTTVESVLNVILSLLRMVLALIRGDWSAAWMEVQNVAQTVWNWILTTITGALDNLNILTNGKLSELAGWFTVKFNEIAAFLRGFNLADIGKAIVQSLIDGIKSMAGGVAAALGSIVADAVAAARSALGGIIGGLTKGVTGGGGGAAQGGAAGQAFGQLAGLGAMSQGLALAPSGENRSYQNTFNVVVNASGGDANQVRRATEQGVLSAARAMGMR